MLKRFLQRRVLGLGIAQAQVLRPTVLRSLIPSPFDIDVLGKQVLEVQRRGKFLLLVLSDSRWLVINPMLTGGLWLCKESRSIPKKVCIILLLNDGMQLRYFDETQMGKLYYLAGEELYQVPKLNDQGPDVLDQPLSFEEFTHRIKGFYGEIKGILTRGLLVSGIGNAYADEVLFDAHIYPFRKRGQITEGDLRALHHSLYTVPKRAVGVLRDRMGEEIQNKVRDFLQVHGKGGEPCPRCQSPITTISANQTLTNYCRRCQAGMLVRNYMNFFKKKIGTF